MANSYTEVTLVTAQTVGFTTPSYLQSAHLLVEVNDVSVPASSVGATNQTFGSFSSSAPLFYSIVEGSTSLNFSEEVPVGAKVTVTRRTSPDTKLVTYANASMVTADVLNESSTQLFYMAQEALDEVDNNTEYTAGSGLTLTDASFSVDNPLNQDTTGNAATATAATTATTANGLAAGVALANLSGGSGTTFLRKDGTWVSPPDNDTTYTSSDFNHDDLTGFLATEHVDWAASQGTNIHANNYTDTTYSNSTTSAHGLMSSTDKTKLDGIAASANNYTHPETVGDKHIPAGGAADQVLTYSSDGTAVWSSIPTLNQDTTGNAATATTATNVAYTGLTGSVPTWNQATTGNADTATTAGTVTTAAQSAITSLGTLTGLTVSGAITATTINAPLEFADSATGTVTDTTFAGYAGKRIVLTGGVAATYQIPTAVAADKGKTWVINNASTQTITMDATTNDQIVHILTGSGLTTKDNVTFSIASGGVAELAVVADGVYGIYGSGIS